MISGLAIGLKTSYPLAFQRFLHIVIEDWRGDDGTSVLNQ